MRKYKELISLKQQIANLETELKELKFRRDCLQEEILVDMAEKGIDNVTVNGFMLYPSRRVWVGGDTEKLAQALKGTDGEWIVKDSVNRNTLSAWVKEQLGDEFSYMSTEEIEQALPEPLRGIASVTEKVTIGMRKKQ